MASEESPDPSGAAGEAPLWRECLPFVLPFLCFMAITAVETAENYLAVYPLKILATSFVWFWFRDAFPAYSRSGIGWGVLIGAAGLPVWILLSGIRLDHLLPAGLSSLVSAGDRVGFNPYDALESQPTLVMFLAIRMLGLAVTVPLMEEVFWRGFLLRFLIDERFRQVPYDRYTPFSFVGVTLLFALAHPEFVAAVVWSAAVTWLLYRTGNLWACIAAHATTNALLGGYVLATGEWWLW